MERSNRNIVMTLSCYDAHYIDMHQSYAAVYPHRSSNYSHTQAMLFAADSHRVGSVSPDAMAALARDADCSIRREGSCSSPRLQLTVRASKGASDVIAPAHHPLWHRKHPNDQHPRLPWSS